MTRVVRSALVPRSRERMYQLVNDFEHYPQLFDWCESAQVVERSDAQVIARMKVRLGGMSATFSTRNTLTPPEKISLQFVDGPFSRFEGTWEFLALGDNGSKISLTLDFEMAGKLVGGALAAGFHKLADHMVEDFVRAALAT